MANPEKKKNWTSRNSALVRNQMQPNATCFDAVSPAQLRAIEALVAGKSVVEAAEAAAVSRATLWRWTRKDVVFQAAYNACRKDAFEQARARISALASLAAETVEAAMRSGDARSAIAVLRGLGILDGEPTAIPTDDIEALRFARLRTEISEMI
ncbi:MAG TPA: hypothetical protein VLV78_23030 [Thermoanaerobaculia bacterium]|nr:hypothetical protein [Thermoanaerobaculia bacterium]